MEAGPPPLSDDLDDALRRCWALLVRGAEDPRSAFRTLTLATLGLDGRPRARTVVSRSVDAAARAVRFHCDRRSDKFAELRADPRVALHGYDGAAGIQIRLEGRATVHTDDPLAEEAWTGSRETSRIAYGTRPAPGRALEAGGAFALPASPEEIAAGRKNFCAVRVAVEALEVLSLAREGHRRARFAWSGGAALATWLVP